MADLLEGFPTTADGTTGEGVVLTSRVEGDASSGKFGLIGFSFKDSSGNVVLPQLRADGALQVAQANEPEKFAYATNSGSLTSVDLATIVGTLNKKYHEFKVTCSCFQESIFSLVYINDVGGTPVETVMGVWRTGPGQFTVNGVIPEFKDLSAGTGVQNFVLRGKNFKKVSTLDGTLSCKEEI